MCIRSKIVSFINVDNSQKTNAQIYNVHQLFAYSRLYHLIGLLLYQRLISYYALIRLQLDYLKFRDLYKTIYCLKKFKMKIYFINLKNIFYRYILHQY